MIKIALIGASGNIGEQACEVVRRYPERFSFSALVCGKNAKRLSELCAEFRPALAALADGGACALPDGTQRLCGGEIVEHIFDGCDVALIAAGGFSGLSYTLKAAERGKKIALANKESLVCGGELVMRVVTQNSAVLVPVDSEHSALFQALSFRRDAAFSKLVLTASGGPFLRYTEAELSAVTARDALKHPTWNMGAKITIDSATMLNKGYEIIEAKWLYGADYSQIEAVVHPESIVHSLVQFEDGAMMAQLGLPDMRLPIQLALTYPERLPCVRQLDLTQVGALHFERLPEERFPCFGLALKAGKAGGTCPTVLNGAAEVAVRAFLSGSIPFAKIAETVSCALDRVPREEAASFAQIEEADARARACAEEYIYGK